MNQADLINQVAEVSGQSKKHVEHTIKTLGDVVQAALQQGEEVTLPGLGKLTVEHKEARKGRNPSTGAEIDIPAKNVPKFSSAKALKDAVNG
jgi:DNA-binding protein HU-beta